MASTSDLGFPSKKRVTTYGKGARRKAQPASSDTPSNGGSTTESSSAPAIARRPGGGRPMKPRVAPEAQSQPLPDIYGFDGSDEEEMRAKRRKLARAFSEKKEKSAAPYSTPDSSPSGAPSPVRRTNGDIPRSAPEEQAPPAVKNTPEKDTEMRDVASQQMPFSAKTSRALDNLSIGSKRVEKASDQIPIRLSQISAPAPAPVSTSSSQPIPRKRPSPQAASRTKTSTVGAPRKKRLIDALAAQAADSSTDEDEEPLPGESNVLRNREPPPFRSPSPPSLSSLSKPNNPVRPVMATKKAGPKFTYSSQQRTMLADEDLLLGGGGGLAGLGGIDEEPSTAGLFSLGRLTKSSTINTFSFLDEDDETVNTGAVRSIHELRQAGANSRFADEMDDIMDRVGAPSAKPSSLRRGALLELAQKVKDKDFRLQFRNHSGDGGLFKSLGEEADLVSGYCISAILVTLFATSVSAHLVQQVRAQGLATLLCRLLAETTDITVLAKDRKQNVSRNGQTTLGTIKSPVLKLPIWEPLAPTDLSPRTLALKCLDLIMRQPHHAAGEAEVFTSSVTNKLFSILSAGASNEACWDFPSKPESADFYLALYVLEGHSINVMQSHLGSRWTRDYAPIIADVLETALRRPAEKLGDVENLALRLTLNTTNNNSEASGLFVNKGLFRELTASACSAFEMVLNSMKVDAFLSKVHESLIMMLGVMINFCVYYPPASQSLEESGDATGSALNRLIRVFADNHSKTSDADSMEKTQLNVALGYLSILLGYLCLGESIRERFVLVHPKKSFQPLLDSINEFIAFHHKVAEQTNEEGAKQDSDFTGLARLQGLVEQLEARRF
ncbi:hypothetical protein B0T24DRAFT_649706 [Lasiosphaeria ovina]|uniref:Wings apart-like protein C-terminal domain-containing protein n=1 Tax=Lasiosphaeria ovina TaxID=92902 RepID=A0AAE0N7V8_9PEZI|nr:hypothetical protein B0T24DRAFT_649706 [Lasiosphaeria ovina]